MIKFEIHNYGDQKNRSRYVVVEYSNSARVVLDVPRRSRGHLTPQSAPLLFYYALRSHIFNNLVNNSLCFQANQLLILKNGTIIVEYLLKDVKREMYTICQ